MTVLALVFTLDLALFNLSAAQEEPGPGPAPAGEVQDDAGRDFGYGVGSVLASLLYSPFKITYAGLGLLTGGLGFVLSGGRPDVANNVLYPALGGNYVITPNHLKGVEPVIFVGPPPPDGAGLPPSDPPS